MKGAQVLAIGDKGGKELAAQAFPRKGDRAAGAMLKSRQSASLELLHVWTDVTDAGLWPGGCKLRITQMALFK